MTIRHTVTCLLLWSGAVFAAEPLSRAPIVFVVLDTSGSMSYVQGPELVTPLCSVDANLAPTADPTAQRDPTATYQMSRDMIAKEVLTGTFRDFWCRERLRPDTRFDAGYPIPWYTPEFATQDNDGIIDVNAERIKFGFATFDTVLKADADALGGWSTGPTAQFLVNVGKTNIGLQNATSPWGRLLVPPPSDESTAVITHNTSVQDEVLRSIPYGGTPIAPALEDTTWLFQNHPSLVKRTTSAPDGDPYKKCRAKNVLLITDGRPNMGEGALGYKTSIQAAERLMKNGYKVFVVGFNLDSGTQTLVNDIAEAGGSEEARLANTPAQLATALSAILGKLTPGLFSRTDAVFTDVTGSTVDLQYQVNSAYSNANTTDVDLAGYMEVTAYRCEDGCRDASGGAGACEVTDARDVLNKRTTARKLYYTLDGVKHPFTKGDIDLTSDLLAIPTSGNLPNLTPELYDQTYRVSGLTLGDASDPTVRLAYRDQLIDLVHAAAGSRRQKERLAGIWHSTPVLQTNLSNIDAQIPSFKSYRTTITNRPTVAYTMTTDGFIRAFHLSQPTALSSPPGTDHLEELWAIAPQAVVGKLNSAATKVQVLADGRLTLKDIRLRRAAAGVSLADEAKEWRSVVVGPYRQGARGLIALDVTDPYKPFVRWEISPDRRCWNSSESASTARCEAGTDDDRSDFRNLGFVHAKVQIGTVFLQVTGPTDLQEVAAAFFPCGDEVDGVPEAGKCFMVVRLDTGEKIKEFRNGNSSVTDDSNALENVVDTLDFPVVGDPVAYNTFIGTFVTRLFVGDAGGQLWRLDVSAPDPKDWKMSFFFDIYQDLENAPLSSTKRSALRAPPALSPVPQRGQLVLVFGSGDIDYAKDGQQTVVYSLKEKLTISTSGLTTGAVTNEVNWRRKLSAGESLTSRPIIFGRTTYFTSYEPDKLDACEGGTGRIWGLDYLDNKGGDPIAALDGDGDSGTPTKAEYVELEDTVPYGATIVSRPACIGDQGVGAGAGSGNSGLRGAQPGQLELVVQTGTTGKTNAAGDPAKGAKSAAVNKFTQKLVRPPKQVISVSWGQVQTL